MVIKRLFSLSACLSVFLHLMFQVNKLSGKEAGKKEEGKGEEEEEGHRGREHGIEKN